MQTSGFSQQGRHLATIRQWLQDAGFDFEAGTIVYHQVESEHRGPGQSDAICAISPMPDDILDKEFEDGYGVTRCPRFFARCGDWIFFPAQYDGATWLEKVNVNPFYYLDFHNETPYPGC